MKEFHQQFRAINRYDFAFIELRSTSGPSRTWYTPKTQAFSGTPWSLHSYRYSKNNMLFYIYRNNDTLQIILVKSEEVEKNTALFRVVILM